MKFTWADATFLAANKVSAWSDMPVWVPGRGDSAGFSRLRNDRAVAKGLTFRPLADTAKSTLDEYRARATTNPGLKLNAGLSREREAAVLALWHGRIQ